VLAGAATQIRQKKEQYVNITSNAMRSEKPVGSRLHPHAKACFKSSFGNCGPATGSTGLTASAALTCGRSGIQTRRHKTCLLTAQDCSEATWYDLGWSQFCYWKPSALMIASVMVVIATPKTIIETGASSAMRTKSLQTDKSDASHRLTAILKLESTSKMQIEKHLDARFNH
jgi:hypothetical protein